MLEYTILLYLYFPISSRLFYNPCCAWRLIFFCLMHLVFIFNSYHTSKEQKKHYICIGVIFYMYHEYSERQRWMWWLHTTSFVSASCMSPFTTKFSSTMRMYRNLSLNNVLLAILVLKPTHDTFKKTIVCSKYNELRFKMMLLLCSCCNMPKAMSIICNM